MKMRAQWVGEQRTGALEGEVVGSGLGVGGWASAPQHQQRLGLPQGLVQSGGEGSFGF